VVPVYAAFFLVMAAIGSLAARFSRLDGPGGLALTLSGMTRNSLVVLPLALALPPTLGLAPLVIVTQTLVELLGLIVYVRVVPLGRALRP
jgi:ACR3 family arsenite transporter